MNISLRFTDFFFFAKRQIVFLIFHSSELGVESKKFFEVFGLIFCPLDPDPGSQNLWIQRILILSTGSKNYKFRTPEDCECNSA